MIRLFGFGMPFEIQTIHYQNNFQPFKIRTCLVFEPPLYLQKLPNFGKYFDLVSLLSKLSRFVNYLFDTRCRDHCCCPAPFILLCFGKRGIFTRSPLMWVFKTLSFICYHVDLPRLPSIQNKPHLC